MRRRHRGRSKPPDLSPSQEAARRYFEQAREYGLARQTEFTSKPRRKSWFEQQQEELYGTSRPGEPLGPQLDHLRRKMERDAALARRRAEIARMREERSTPSRQPSREEQSPPRNRPGGSRSADLTPDPCAALERAGTGNGQTRPKPPDRSNRRQMRAVESYYRRLRELC